MWLFTLLDYNFPSSANVTRSLSNGVHNLELLRVFTLQELLGTTENPQWQVSPLRKVQSRTNLSDLFIHCNLQKWHQSNALEPSKKMEKLCRMLLPTKWTVLTKSSKPCYSSDLNFLIKKCFFQKVDSPVVGYYIEPSRTRNLAFSLVQLKIQVPEKNQFWFWKEPFGP